jgi:hypothetical protein
VIKDIKPVLLRPNWVEDLKDILDHVMTTRPEGISDQQWSDYVKNIVDIYSAIAGPVQIHELKEYLMIAILREDIEARKGKKQ